MKTQGDGVADVSKIGEINPKHFENVFPVLTNDVVITDERIAHIKAHHPKDYERYAEYIPQILKNPDYILKANRPHSAVLLKEFKKSDERFQLILRLRTSQDPDEFSNSVITFSRLHAKEYRRFVRNKKVLYKSE